MGVRAARDRVSVPVSLTEFECAFTLRLIFAPLLGVFPCFGALTIALVDEPSVDFDLRVVGGDVTLVPGLRAPLRSYIKALVASWMVWPRCITVAIPGTGYELPGDAAERKPEIVGVLRVQVIGHQFVNNAGGGDARRDAEGELGLQVRWPVAELAGVAGLGAGASEGKGPASQSEERVAALANGAGDPGRSRLRWRIRGRSFCACVGTDATRTRTGAPRVSSRAATISASRARTRHCGKKRVRSARGGGERRSRPSCARRRRRRGDRARRLFVADDDDRGRRELGAGGGGGGAEPPPGADIASVRGASDETGGLLGLGRRAARGVGGLWGKSASGVVAGYRAARAEGLGSVRGAVAEGWRGESRRRRRRR